MNIEVERINEGIKNSPKEYIENTNMDYFTALSR